MLPIVPSSKFIQKSIDSLSLSLSLSEDQRRIKEANRSCGRTKYKIKLAD